MANLRLTANLQITAKLRHMMKLGNPRHARPTATRLLTCVWLSFHGYTAILDPTGKPTTFGSQTALGQEVIGSNTAPDETEDSNQKTTGNETATANLKSAVSQESADAETDASGTPVNTEQTSGSAPKPLTPEQQEQIDSLINQLSARKFSQRESAATKLLQIGIPALPSLRKQLELTGETETQIRITELINQLIDGRIDVQIEDFMAMKPVRFEGWFEIKLLLGKDSIATRALFVEILRSHPTLPTSMQLKRTNRDRSIAIESVIAAMQKKRIRETPTTADAFALLLPLYYLDLVMPQESDDLVISVLQSSTGTNLRKDIQLSPGFRFLLGRWITQSSLANREDVLFYGMDWDMPQCQILAKDTILNEKNASPAVLASCLQALAKFGSRRDVAAIRTLLSDKRSVSQPTISTQGTRTNQVSDLAIAAIACIHGVDLEDVGFTGVSRDPRYGFLPREIGFPKEAPEKRADAEKMIKAILDASPPVEPPLPVPPLAPGIGN
jgi:hypothetical protein